MDVTTKVSQGNRSLKLYAKRLEKLNITTLEDLLYHLPSRYEDYSLVSPIGSLQQGEVVTVKGEVTEAKNDYTRRFRTLQKVTISDGTGSIDLTWFNQPFLVKNLHVGDTLSVSGRVDTFAHRLALVSPEYEIIGEDTPLIHTGRLVPVYPETRGVSSKWLRRQIFQLLNEITPALEEYLPESIRNNNNLLQLQQALQEVHFPTSFEQAIRARERLGFDELFFLQLSGLMRRQLWHKSKHGPAFSTTPHQHEIDKLLSSLPFTLTSSQEAAVKQILQDMTQTQSMNRLLQGDVGSGKTIVAAIAMYVAFLNGFQSTLMAPTEILAQQHFKTIQDILSPFGVQVGLITGSKKSNIQDPKSKIDILVGTHALVAGKADFDRLGLVVIDEQQRFGVKQRGILREKGDSPHVLTMTATPIPRTVALAFYGDLDVSYLSEMPKGRKKIKTWLVPSEKRKSAYDWIRKEIKQTDSQVFIICPFIEESENMQTVKAATVEFKRLQQDVFPDLNLGLLHGKLKAREKDEVLQGFREKKYDILVATPVVEVGIDIPNATIIMIEAAERFGLAQLHQLRGRVGRGDKQSYCLLFTQSPSEQTKLRLKAMETMYAGASLAEYDLKMRGPGNLYGFAQSGRSLLKIATFSDSSLLTKARNAAGIIFPNIENFPALLEKLNGTLSQQVAPD